MLQIGDLVELKTYRHYLDDGLISGDKGVIESEITYDNELIGYVVRFSNGLEDVFVNVSLTEIKLITRFNASRVGLTISGLLIVATAIFGLISFGVISELAGIIFLGIISLFAIN